jgi:hypothetical protein
MTLLPATSRTWRGCSPRRCSRRGDAPVTSLGSPGGGGIGGGHRESASAAQVSVASSSMTRRVLRIEHRAGMMNRTRPPADDRELPSHTFLIRTHHGPWGPLKSFTMTSRSVCHCWDYDDSSTETDDDHGREAGAGCPVRGWVERQGLGLRGLTVGALVPHPLGEYCGSGSGRADLLGFGGDQEACGVGDRNSERRTEPWRKR